MPISKPAESAYQTASDEGKMVIDAVVRDLGSDEDWSRRSAVLLEMIDALDLAMNGDVDEEDDEDEAADANATPSDPEAGEFDEDDLDSESDFAEILTYYIGAVLERLEETEIRGPEQAAFYLLSCHPEHLEAAQDWIEQPDNAQRFRTFVEQNPDYGALLELIEEMYSGMIDEEG